MRTRFFSLLVTATLLIGAASTAQAESRFYAGVGIGEETGGPVFEPEVVPFSTHENVDNSFKAFFGARLHKYFGVEATYHDFGSQTSHLFLEVIDITDRTGWSLVGIGRLPLGERWELFAKAGQLWWEEDGTRFTDVVGLEFPIDRSGNDLLVGAGARFEISERFAVRGEWERFEFEGVDDSAGAVGLEIAF